MLNNNLISLPRVLAEVPPELVNSVLTNYTRGGRVAPQVIAYILDNQGWTIPTLSYLFRAPKQTIDQILKKLRPWVTQTSVKLEHPIKGSGNKPYLWIKTGVDPQEAEEEARAFYSAILEKYDPAIKRAKAERRAKEEAIAQDLARRDLLVSQVIESLRSPPEKLSRVYEEMRALGLSQGDPDWLYVNQKVIAWIHDHREADS